MPNQFKVILAAFIAGVVFASGLIIASMNNPIYIQGFLNIGGLFDKARFGGWYPKLAFVMLSAVLIMFFVFYFTRPPLPSNVKPLLTDSFDLPNKMQIDKQLIIGASVFGIGWGLYGYCPGPAIASLLIAGPNLLIFILFMLIGALLAKKIS
ncbi:hypothetical protein DES39_0706 [Orbus hercynius]|uniref:Sulphur transport domain-containing protein n=1 Tax=Orbus hercynius TaxID=593135 RepID=A0A495RIW0_9GAMM|nr:DUF6691 family protein [Orbus hercynius]RKS87472.1 hypothetical protein DES39_0706 [Orbus hercynius]